MSWRISPRSTWIWWQLLFILLSTSWLWAPHLNHLLSYRTALISQYELPSQPYSWLFRSADLLGAALLALMAYLYLKRFNYKTVGWLIMAMAIGSLLDPL